MDSAEDTPLRLAIIEDAIRVLRSEQSVPSRHRGRAAGVKRSSCRSDWQEASMAHVACVVPDCHAAAAIVINQHPLCSAHCQELAKHTLVLDMSVSDVLKPETSSLAEPEGEA